MPQDWNGRDRELKQKEEENEKNSGRRTEQKCRGGGCCCNCFPAQRSLVPVRPRPSLPAEPDSTRSQTWEGGLNQTYEPQNMTWQVQQEKRGGGESWCELIELHSAKSTVWGGWKRSDWQAAVHNDCIGRWGLLLRVLTLRRCCTVTVAGPLSQRVTHHRHHACP